MCFGQTNGALFVRKSPSTPTKVQRTWPYHSCSLARACEVRCSPKSCPQSLVPCRLSHVHRSMCGVSSVHSVTVARAASSSASSSDVIYPLSFDMRPRTTGSTHLRQHRACILRSIQIHITSSLVQTLSPRAGDEYFELH
jgi:hypothetical protein